MPIKAHSELLYSHILKIWLVGWFEKFITLYHRINPYSVDSVVCYAIITYPVNCDLSGG